jgi:putative nucleotidyltransferase with HDIG domain
MAQARDHDPALHHHCLLVAELCAQFSAFLNFSIAEQRILTRAGLLHDIGKIEITPAVLTKPLGLATEEIAIVRTHTELGYELLLEAGESDKKRSRCRSRPSRKTRWDRLSPEVDR